MSSDDNKNENKTDDITKMMLKLEAARELGLIEKVKEVGWGGLTSEESGKVGGYMTKKIYSLKNKDKEVKERNEGDST